MDLVSVGVAKNNKPDSWWWSVCLSIALFSVFGLSFLVVTPAEVEAVGPIGAWATSSAAGNDDAWQGVTYGNGRFVALSDSGDRVMYSDDGITWATTTAVGNNDSWKSVTYGSGRFVGVSNFGDRVMTSTDGLSWTAVATSSAAGNDDAWQGVTYGNGRFVAVACGTASSCNATVGDRVMYSTDGLTWATTTAAGNDDSWYGVTYGNGRFVAVSNLGDRVMYSTDGLTWATTTAAGNDDAWQGVTYGNGRFVAVACGTASSCNATVGDRVMYSTDGLTWATSSAAGDNDYWQSITYGNGRFVAVSNLGDRVMTSTDGLSWATSSAAGDNDQWNAVTYGDNFFVAVGQSGDKVMSAALAPWSLSQTGFQWRNDNGTETTATYRPGQNANTTWPLNSNIRLRTQITSPLATTSAPYALQYRPLNQPYWHRVGEDDGAPYIFATSSGRASGNATSHSVAYPAGEAGDVILMIMSIDDAGPASISTAGWNKMAEGSNDSATVPVVSSAVFWKFADAADSAGSSVSVALAVTQEVSWVVYRVRGAGVPSGTGANGSGTNSNPVTHSLPATTSVLWIAARSGDAQVRATTSPANYQDLITVIATTTTGASTNAAHRTARLLQDDPGTFTSLTEQWVTWTIAIPPKQTPSTRTLAASFGNTPTTANNTSYGSIAWTTATNGTSSDNARAAVTVSSTTATNELRATNYGFTIPSNATITGIEAFVEKVRTAGGGVGDARDNSVRLLKNGTTTGVTNLAVATAWLTTEEIATYGSTTAMWGTTWTPADINDSANFGLAFAAQGVAAGANRIANIDHIIVNVYYTTLSPISIATSTNVAPGGASTTGQLIPMMQSSTVNFTAGRISDEAGTTTERDLGEDQYTEYEWSLQATGSAAIGEVYEIRTALNMPDGPLTDYPTYIQLQVGTTTTQGTTTLTGFAYASYSTTTLGAGAQVVAAMNQRGNPVLFSTTTRAGGAFTVPLSIGTSSAVTNWNAVSATGNNDAWQGVTYGNGRFVAVSNSGDRVMTSTDGLTWATTSAVGDNDTWQSVTYGNGRFVAVGSGGTERVMYSTDGLTWATTSAVGDNDTWQSVTYGNGRFVAVSVSVTDNVMTSTDGLVWATTSAAGNNDWWNSVTYGNGRFVAVGDTAIDNVMTSTDGLTWATTSAAGNNDTWESVTYGNGRFVAVADNGDRVMYSTDGLTWATTSAAGNNDAWYAVTYGNGRFVAVGNTAIDNVMTSTDVLTWATTSAAGNNDWWNSVTYGNGRFVAVGDSGDRVMISSLDEQLGVDTPVVLYLNGTTTDATTFFEGLSTTTGTFANVPLYGNTVLVYNATTSSTSNVTDLENLSLFDSENDSDVLYTVASGATTTILADFVTATGTTKAPGKLSFVPNSLVSTWNQVGVFDANGGTVEFAGDITQTSGVFTGSSSLATLSLNPQSRGSMWRVGSESTYVYITAYADMVFGEGKFVVVTSGGILIDDNDIGPRVWYSTDGLTWATTSAAGNNDIWQSVAYGNGRFVAVGSSTVGFTDVVMYSDDGITWATTSAAGNDDSWQSVTYGNGRFVVVGQSGDRVMYSTDGLTWATTSAAGNDDSWTSVMFGENMFVAVGSGPDGAAAMYSQNGVVWATSSVGFTDNDMWTAVTYGGDRFVAVDFTGVNVLMYSLDGITWTASTSDGVNAYYDVVYGNGVFLFFDAYGLTWYSYDGITLLPAITAGVGYNESGFVATAISSFLGAEYGNGRFVGMAPVNGEIFVPFVSGMWTQMNASTTIKNLIIAEHAWISFLSTTTTNTITGDLTNGGIIDTRVDESFDPFRYNPIYLTGASTTLTLKANATAYPYVHTLLVTGSTTLGSNASTSELTVAQGAQVNTSGQTVEIAKTFNQLGTWQSNAASNLFFRGTTTNFYGNATGTNAFQDVTVGTKTAWGTAYVGTNSSANNLQAVVYGNGKFVAVGSSTPVAYSGDGLTWATTSAAGNNDDWKSIAYGEGIYVAVGMNGDRVMYSTTTTSWTAASVAGNNDNWISVTYGEGRFVAVACGGSSGPNCGGPAGDRVMYSDDGITWATTSAAGNDDTWFDVTYGNGRFVAVATAGTDYLMHSDDGITWVSEGTSFNGQQITYGNGRFVAVGGGAPRVVTSTDGLTWATTTIAVDFAPYDLQYGNGRFIASAPGLIYYSYDGFTWAVAPHDSLDITQFESSDVIHSVAYGGGQFIGVGLVSPFPVLPANILRIVDSTHTFNAAASTSNITIATSSTLMAPTSTLSVSGSFANYGTYVPRAGTTTLTGVGANIYGSLTSWNETTQSPDYGLTNIAGTYQFIGNATTSALTINSGNSLNAPSGGTLTIAHDFINNGSYSNLGATTTVGGNLRSGATDTNALGNTVINARSQGLEWEAIATSSAAGNNDNWYGLTYGNGLFVAVGGSPGVDRVMYSVDGLVWATTSAAGNNDTWKDIIYGNGRFVAVGSSGDRVMTSTDGIAWTAVSTSSAAGNNDSWAAVTYGNGRFVAVGDGPDKFMYSNDGLIWATTSAGGGNEFWTDVTYGNGLFVAVTYFGDTRVVYSRDGVTWASTSAAGNDDFWNSVTYGNGRFVAIGDSYGGDWGMYSIDGISWAVTTVPSGNWGPITYGNGRFIAMGSGLGVVTSYDGITWATTSASGNNDNWQSVTYGNGRFVGVSCGDASCLSGAADRIVTSLGTSFFTTNASTSNLTINASSTLNASGTTITVGGNYTNSGTLTASSSTFIFNGTSAQVATGTLSASSSFRNLTLSNTSGNGTTSRSIIFGAPLSVTGTSTITASTSVAFLANSTTSIATAVWQGSAGSPVYLRSSATGTQSFLTITGNKTVDFVDVRDSNASGTSGGITPTNSINSGNNSNWNFGGVGVPVWNATDWTLYDTITIQEENIDTDLTDFPVYVNLDDLSSTFWSTTPAGASLVGTDIRVTTASNVEVPRELVFASSTLGTGELHFKAPSISSTTDTVFKIWYNGTTTGDYATNATYGAENVWTNDFVLVAHLQQDPSGGVGAVLDSTRFNHDGTGSSTMTAADLVTGKVGSAFDFDGAAITDSVSFATSTNFANLRNVSVCTWYQHDTFPGSYNYLMDKSSDGSNSWNFSVENSSRPIMQSIAGGYQYGTTSSLVGWRYLCATTNGSGGAGGIIVYENGLNTDDAGAGFGAGSDDTNTPMTIGSGKDSFRTDGRMDEVRIASTTRAASWIKAEYYNQSTSTDFYSVTAAAPVWNATDWTLYDTITIQQENIDSDLTDFPVYVNLDDLSSTFWSTTPTGSSTVGTDIRVTTASNVEVPRELVTASSTLQTGELHFKAPTISSTTDTVFKIWYNGTTTGDYADSATYGAENVWTNDYVAVWHLQEDPSVAGASGILDATGNGNNGTDNGSMDATDAVSGKLGGRSLDFDGVDDFIQVTGLLGTPAEVTVSSWANLDTYDSGGSDIVSIGDYIVLDTTAANTRGNFYNGSIWRTLLGTSNGAGVWNHMVYTQSNSGSQQRIYKNNIKTTGAIADDTSYTGLGSNTIIGKHGNGEATHDTDGRMDELRVASTTRTDAWIRAEYTNQSTSTDFYSVNLAGAVGSSTIANHTSGQVNNTFTGGPKTNESLFAFRLTPNSGNATVTDAVITLTGVQGFNPVTGLTNLRLFRDIDNDALYDVTDVAVGGAGAIVGANQNGTLTFTTDFLSTTSQNYLVVGDWSAPADGTFITFNLFPSGLTIIDATSSQSVFGSVSSAQHYRNNRGGGGQSASIGGGAPAGNGTTTGGGTTGGQLIGDDPDFFWPSANSGSWNSGANAYDRQDGTYATTSAAVTHTYTNPGFAIPTNNTIGGIEVKLELGGTTGAGTVNVELSWNNGANWTSAKTTPTLTTTDTVRVLGAPADLWGRSWTASEFTNANFALRLTGAPSANTIRVDAIQIKVYHAAGGGSQGGGGGGI